MSEKNDRFVQAMRDAERDCFDKLCEILGLTEGRNAYLSVRGNSIDCIVFDIGSPQTGDMLAFPSSVFHWKGQMDVYSRSRKDLQALLMRLIAAMPIGTTQSTEEQMRSGSNVQNFRIMPMQDAIKEITTTPLKSGTGEKEIEVFTSTVIFDIVFNAGSRTS